MKILTNTRAAATGLAVAALAATGVAVGSAPAEAAPTSAWDRVAACESGGNWHISTGNGYYGGLQFSLSTWHGYGGVGNPADASKSEQIRIAEKVLAGQGWNAWPVCSYKAGVRGESASAVSSAPSHVTVRRSTTSTTRSSAPRRTTTHVAAAAPAAPRHRATVKLSGRTYTVRSGDYLSKIAQHLGVSGGWERLADANPQVVDPNLIYVGQRLNLPA